MIGIVDGHVCIKCSCSLLRLIDRVAPDPIIMTWLRGSRGLWATIVSVATKTRDRGQSIQKELVTGVYHWSLMLVEVVKGCGSVRIASKERRRMLCVLTFNFCQLRITAVLLWVHTRDVPRTLCVSLSNGSLIGRQHLFYSEACK